MPKIDDIGFFIHIPKTGGTTIETLFNIEKKKENLYGLLEHNNKTYSLEHLTPDELVDLGLIDEADLLARFVFCFVRNPWDRIVSEYFMRKKYNTVCCSTKCYYDSFETFVKNIKHLSNDKIHNNHFRKQVEFLKFRNERLVNFIGKFENYSNDYHQICKILKKSHSLEKHRTTKHEHYSTYYNDETKNIIGDLYQEDIKAFNYEF